MPLSIEEYPNLQSRLLCDIGRRQDYPENRSEPRNLHPVSRQKSDQFVKYVSLNIFLKAIVIFEGDSKDSKCSSEAMQPDDINANPWIIVVRMLRPYDQK